VRIVSPETCKKISESHKGKSSGMKGKKYTEEAKRRLSLARMGRPVSQRHIDLLVARSIGNTYGCGRIPWNKGKKYHNKRTLGVSNGCC